MKKKEVVEIKKETKSTEVKKPEEKSINKIEELSEPISKPIAETVKETIIEKEVEPTKEKMVFEGKIVKFPLNTKTSDAYKILEHNKISKDKLNYIFVQHENDKISVAKYNQKAEFKLLEFVNSLFKVYNKNEQLRESLKDIKLSGNDTFFIIQNIPSDFISIVSKDLMKLLSK